MTVQIIHAMIPKSYIKFWHTLPRANAINVSDINTWVGLLLDFLWFSIQTSRTKVKFTNHKAGFHG